MLCENNQSIVMKKIYLIAKNYLKKKIFCIDQIMLSDIMYNKFAK